MSGLHSAEGRSEAAGATTNLPSSTPAPIHPPRSPHTDALPLTIDGYIARASARMASMGFYEKSTHNVTEQFGNIVQVWRTYESRHAPSDPTPFARGINSFQLLKDGDRYWVVNISGTPNPQPPPSQPNTSLPPPNPNVHP